MPNNQLAMQPIITLNNVGFCYGHAQILEHINLTVEKGEFLGIIGPNGSGKTTLLKLIVGLLKPHSGTVTVTLPPSHIAYIRQKATQFDVRFPISVREVVGMGRAPRVGLFRPLARNDQEQIDHALELVEMQHYDRHLIRDLSGGQQQRVLIAKALAASSDLLILDEPTVGIDSASQQSFYTLLSRINKNHSITLIIVSHDVEVIVQEVKRIVCLNKTILDHCNPHDFLQGHIVHHH